MDQDDTAKPAFSLMISLPIYIGFEITHLKTMVLSRQMMSQVLAFAQILAICHIFLAPDVF